MRNTINFLTGVITAYVFMVVAGKIYQFFTYEPPIQGEGIELGAEAIRAIVEAFVAIGAFAIYMLRNLIKSGFRFVYILVTKKKPTLIELD